MSRLVLLLSLLYKGRELANAETWKNRQVLVNALVATLGAALAMAQAFGLSLELSNGQIVEMAGAMAGAVGLFNGFVTVASSERVGLPRADSADDNPSHFPDERLGV